MGRIKWAVLGSCGIAKRRTIPEGILAAKNAELIAVYDLNTEANATLGNELGVHAVGSEAELLSSDAEVIYIATPADLHHRQVLACAAAGKHVLCEKPLGMTAADAEEMISACERADVKLGVGFMMRFLAQHQAALKLIQEGKLGKPVYARAQLSCWYPPMEGAWRQDPATGAGGSLIDMGGHCIDLLEMFFGNVKRVSCFIHNSVHGYASEDSAVAALFFENGAMATVDTFFCIPDTSSKNMLELYGSKGSILAKGTIGQGEGGEMVAFLEGNDAVYEARQSRNTGAGMEIAPEPVNMYRAEVEEFSTAIRDGRETALNAGIGLRSQKILAACYESARCGNSIKIM